METIELRRDLAEILHQYLTTRPYREVAEGVRALEQALMAAQQQAEHPTPPPSPQPLEVKDE